MFQIIAALYFLERLLEDQRRHFATGTYANATTINLDDVKSLIWKGANFESLVEKKKIQVPILRLYTGTEAIANKGSLLEQIKKENDEVVKRRKVAVNHYWKNECDNKIY